MPVRLESQSMLSRHSQSLPFQLHCVNVDVPCSDVKNPANDLGTTLL
jgi:hypothetical protein